MKFRSGLLVGLGAGYVLGAKAGRERYQQIVQATRSFMDNPGVQRLTDEVGKTVSVGKDRMAGVTSRKVEQVSTTLADQANRAKSLVEAKSGTAETAEQPPTAKPAAPPKTSPTAREEATAGTPPATPTRGGRPR